MLKFFKVPFANSGDKTDVPDPVQSDGTVNYEKGYPSKYSLPSTDPNTLKITRVSMNDLFFQITNALKELQSTGIPDFITSDLNGGVAFTYSAFALVRYQGIAYMSLSNANTALPTDDTKWSVLGTITGLVEAGTGITIDGTGTIDDPYVINSSGGGGTPGGSDHQVQYNNNGAFGGFTVSGDATLDTSTGALTVVSIGGQQLATVAFTGAYADVTGTPTNLSQFNNDPGFITSSQAPVQSVAGRGGNVILTLADITNAGTLAGLNSVDLSGSQATGILASARFPALSGDITNTAGSIVTTLKNTGTAGTYTKTTTDAQGRVTSGAQASLTDISSPTADFSMASHKLTSVTDPTNPQDAATKAYVDAIAAGLSPKGSSKMATTANLTATYGNGASGIGATLTNIGTLAALTIDGVAAAVGNRILVKNQSTALQNGIYTVTTIGSGAVAWVLTRATDYDTSAEINEGTFTVVEEGTTNTGTLWIMTTNGTVTVGTTSIVFTQLVVASQTVTLIGVVTGTGAGSITTTIANNAVTNAMLAQMPSNTIKGNVSVSTATPADLTATQVRTFLNLATVATSGSYTDLINTPPAQKRGVGFTAGAPVVGKITGYSVFPQAGTITAYNIVSNAGTATIRVWKIASGTAAPTVSNNINTAGVSLSTGTAIRSTTVTDFTTTAVAANDIFAFEITAVSGATEISFFLEID